MRFVIYCVSTHVFSAFRRGLLNEVLNGKRAVSTEYALLFEAALNIDPEPLLKMQADYNMQIAKSDPSFLERLANIRKIAAVL